MTKSESIAALAAALVAAQSEFGPIKRTEEAKIPTRNGNGYSYKYADLHAVVEATRPALLKHGLTVLQFPQAEPGKVSITSLLTHASGEYVSEVTTIPVTTDTPQAVGTGVTYARRYSLMAILGLAAEDDDGAGASRKPAKQAEPAAPAEPPGYGDWKVKLTLEARKGMTALKSLWTASPKQYRDYAMGQDSTWWNATKASISKEVVA